jgi:hypothetical protein
VSSINTYERKLCSVLFTYRVNSVSIDNIFMWIYIHIGQGSQKAVVPVMMMMMMMMIYPYIKDDLLLTMCACCSWWMAFNVGLYASFSHV